MTGKAGISRLQLKRVNSKNLPNTTALVKCRRKNKIFLKQDHKNKKHKTMKMEKNVKWLRLPSGVAWTQEAEEGLYQIAKRLKMEQTYRRNQLRKSQ